MKILVVRNDKLGDFVLALPAFSMLKKSLPDAKITALVPKYTASLAESIDYIDDILLDTNDSIFVLRKKLKQFDVIISLFSRKKVAIASFLAGVPHRFAPATKLWQFFYNFRLTQRRSQSLKPEFEYNIDLIKFFLKQQNIEIKSTKTPYINLSKPNKTQQNMVVIIHSGSGGSANNLSSSQYAMLADCLYKKSNTIKILISAGPFEKNIADELMAKITVPCELLFSIKGLMEFCEHINSADLFIGGSTGVLHLAGALNINTAGFYPNKKSSTALRWQTLNNADKRLCFSPDDGSDDMIKINMPIVADKIYNQFFTKL